ncbi:LysR family transcriptional regulator [Roseomonas elaeocarpi]|uniref:LysR family transcriptional regulator n=1 Tax=Roseomonas elaeocarpi TaxID=907779 RepID=A0ABV6JV52_9PROT
MSPNSPQHPGLAALEAFLAVARLGSFRAAATARGVTPSAFSHAMRGLEARLGTRLFHRTSRSVRLTEAGERLVARLAPALGEIEDAVAALGAEAAQPSGRLRLNVPHSAVPLIIAPLLPRFLADYPAVTLEVVAEDGLVDIVAAGFDAGIRPEWRLTPGMTAVPLRPRRRFAVVASPAYLARRGTPESPAALAGHDCIVQRYPSGGRYAWEFARDSETLRVEVAGRVASNDPALRRAAAIAGAGLAHLFEHDVADALAAGRLTRVLTEWCPPLPGFSLYYPGRRQPPPALRAFIATARQVLAVGDESS